MLRGPVELVKLFEELGPRYEHRSGGYTRVMKLQRPRVGDKADMAFVEFVDRRGELRQARAVSDDMGPLGLAQID